MNKSSARELDSDWLEWLHVNVSRGCSTGELIDILLSAGFKKDAVQRAYQAISIRRYCAAVQVAPNIPNATKLASEKVELYMADHFLTSLHCAALVAIIESKLRPSTISSPPGHDYDRAFRTSRTCDLVDAEAPVLALDATICACMGIDPFNAEPTQGQRYEVGQEFKQHTDYFKPYELEKYRFGNLGQRSWTFMIYLDEPLGGGETHFPELDVVIQPKIGRALVWNNLLPSGAPNSSTRHQGMPVTSGRKTVITKWFRIPVQDPPV